MTDQSELHVFDLSRWKPIPLAEFMLSLPHLYLTIEEDKDPVLNIEYLPNNRARIVIGALVTWGEQQSAVQPYLMALYSDGGATGYKDPICFIRTDVDLLLS